MPHVLVAHLRNIYHYRCHIGEAHAVRQQLGHRDLPQFVGDMGSIPFQPDLNPVK